MMTDDLKMTLVESKELGKIILTVFLTDEHNILLGKVWGDVSGNRFQIAESFVYAAARGQGHGYAMYRRLIDEALGRGLEVYSDSMVSYRAARIYDKLEREGYTVTELAEDMDQGEGGGEPAFRVLAPKQRLSDGILPGMPTMLSLDNHPDAREENA